MGRSTYYKSTKRGNDSPHFNHSGDTQSAKVSLRATNMLTNIGNAPTQNLSPPVTDQPPLAPAKLLIILRTQNKYQRGFGRRSKSCTSSTKRIFSQKYVTFKTGKIGKDESLIINEEKVEAWFGKELKIVLDRVDKVKEGNSRRGIRPQSRFHCDILCTDGSYPENAVTAPSISCDKDSLDGPIKTENQLICERDLSDLEHLLVNDLVPKAEIDNRDVEFIDQRILVPIVKLETDRDTEVETPNTVTGSFTNLSTNQGDITICDLSAEWKMSSLSPNEINQSSFQSPLKCKSRLICDKDSAIVSDNKPPVTNNLVLKAEIDKRLLEFSDPPFFDPSVKLETAQDTEVETLNTATGSFTNLPTNQNDITICDLSADWKISSMSPNEINQSSFQSPLKCKSRLICDKDSAIVSDNKPPVTNNLVLKAEIDKRLLEFSDPPFFDPSVKLETAQDTEVETLNTATGSFTNLPTNQNDITICDLSADWKISSMSSNEINHISFRSLIKYESHLICDEDSAIVSGYELPVTNKLVLKAEIDNRLLEFSDPPFSVPNVKLETARDTEFDTLYTVTGSLENLSTDQGDTTPCDQCEESKISSLSYNEINEGCLSSPIKLMNNQKCEDSIEKLSEIVRGNEAEDQPCCIAESPAESILEDAINNVLTVSIQGKQYSCPLCNATFSVNNHLFKHLRTHTDVKLFECTHCNAIFSDSGSLTHHIKTHETFECSHCNAKFFTKRSQSSHIKTHATFPCFHCEATFLDKRSLNSHIKTHKLFECSHCNAKFSTKGILSSHIKTHKKTVECFHCHEKFSNERSLSSHIKMHEPFACFFCKTTFSSQINLTTHIKIHSVENLSLFIKANFFSATGSNAAISENDQTSEHLKTHTNPRLLKCIPCSLSFCDRESLNSHIKTHKGKPFYCPLCIEKFSKEDDLKRHLRLTHPPKKSVECPLCNAKFRKPNELKAHMPKHTGEKPYSCTLCIKNYSDRGTLYRHKLRKHTEKKIECEHCKKKFCSKAEVRLHMLAHTSERPYKCTLCDAKFPSEYRLKNHLKSHSFKKPYACTQCDAKFKRNDHLKRHSRIHTGVTGERPFECDYCKARFILKSALINHIRTHTGEKPFKCAQCDAKFSAKLYLTQHVIRHNKYKRFECAYCNIKFYNKDLLLKHIRIHTGEKPIKCTHCKRKFTNKNNLHTHLRTHTGEKPHACTYCKKKFSARSNLVTHMRIHTGEKTYRCKHCDEKFCYKGSLETHIRTHTSK